MNRSEHIRWCKTRALSYVNEGDVSNAFASLVSDLRKHDETRDHAAIELGFVLTMAGHLSTPQQMRDFIEGCN